MITRIRQGRTRPGQAGEYEPLLLEHVFPEIAARALSGWPGYELLRRERSHEVEFVTIMHFDDQAALHTFDHLDGSAEGVPPEARTLLAPFDSLSSHYRTVAVRAGGHTA